MLLAHAGPSSGIEDLMRQALERGPLVCLELDEGELATFLGLLEETGNSAQNEVAMDRLGRALERVSAGLVGNADPGLHMLRPAISRLDMSYKQGQHLAFIYMFTRVHRRAPSESDIQAYFRTTPPAAHEMLKTLERKQFISRTTGMARSTRILLPPHEIPELERQLPTWLGAVPHRSSVPITIMVCRCPVDFRPLSQLRQECDR